MSKVYIYLGGPIAGATEGEAKDWRKTVTDALKPHNIIGISPLRCEPLMNRTHYDIPKPGEGAIYNGDQKFGTGNAIRAKNRLDVMACDMTLAYLPRYMNERRPSYGTVMEIGWSDMAGKPIILVTDDPYLGNHPVIKESCDWRLNTLEDAIELIIGLYGDYARE